MVAKWNDLEDEEMVLENLQRKAAIARKRRRQAYEHEEHAQKRQNSRVCRFDDDADAQYEQYLRYGFIDDYEDAYEA